MTTHEYPDRSKAFPNAKEARRRIDSLENTRNAQALKNAEDKILDAIQAGRSEVNLFEMPDPVQKHLTDLGYGVKYCPVTSPHADQRDQPYWAVSW